MRHRRHDRCGPRLQPVWNFRQPACRPPSSKALACSPHATNLKSKLQPQKSSEWRGGLLGRLDSHELSKKVAGFAQRLDRWNSALLFVWSYETIWSSEDVLVYVLLPGLFHRCIPAVSFFQQTNSTCHGFPCCGRNQNGNFCVNFVRPPLDVVQTQALEQR